MIGTAATPPPEIPLTPVCLECVVDAAEFQQVPLAALIGIMAVEGGQVGKVSPNPNGTYDIGPMQINSVHLPKLKKLGISETMVLNNGCFNVHVGAWLLAKHLKEQKNNLWEAIGRYHSKTLKYKVTYQWKVYKALKKLKSLKNLIWRANGWSK